MAQYFEGRPLHEGRVGVLASAFNPPTIAHVALAEACRKAADLDQVAFALARRLPHKRFDDVAFEQRMEMLVALTSTRPEWASVATEGGLFVEMAREVKSLGGEPVEALLLCGRDAAERIVGWDYGEEPSIEQQLREFAMVVAGRHGDFAPPPELAGRIVTVALPADCRDVSSSAVRAAIAAGAGWSGLVPAAVASRIRSLGLYGV